ncbi:retention module-containing protein, partial [Thioalkalivibrio sp. ALJ16]|uniref:retention module-containing protein n=1 Tax=Thioalkalivibrio sp. ALJ16 TaxID=1158762 RepID=UPI00037EA898
MSEVVVATVESVVGTVIARDEDGNTRVLQPGDQIFYGEEVIAEDGAFIEMAFEDGSTMSLAGNESATITADLADSAESSPEDGEIAEATVEEIIAALDRGEDITDLLEAPAAGVDGGGAGEGGGFVRVARSAEEVDPVSYAYDANALRGAVGAEVGDVGTLGEGPAAGLEEDPEPVAEIPSGSIIVSSFFYAPGFSDIPSEEIPLDAQIDAEVSGSIVESDSGQGVIATISGSTEEISPGAFIALAITDADENRVQHGSTDGGEIVVEEDGSWTATNVDITGLNPGSLLIEGFVVDQNGDEQSSELNVEFTLPFVEISDFEFAPEGFVGGEEGQPNASLVIGASNATSVTVSVTGSDGSTEEVKATLDNGVWVVDLASLNFEGGVDYTVSAVASDDLGFIAVSDALDASFELPNAPGVTIANGDGFINADEVDEDGNVAVTIDLTDTNAEADDILTVNGNEITLTEDHINAGQVVTAVAAPDEGETLEVVATITDAAGNTSDEGTA